MGKELFDDLFDDYNSQGKDHVVEDDNHNIFDSLLKNNHHDTGIVDVVFPGDDDNEEVFFDDDDLDFSVDENNDFFDENLFRQLWVEDGYTQDKSVNFNDYLFDESLPEAVRAKLFQLDTLLGRAFDEGASDVHLIPGDYVTYRVLGQQKKIKKYGVLTQYDTEVLASRCVSNRDRDNLAVYKSIDAAYTLRVGKHRGRRTRLSVGRSFGYIYLVFRLISETIPSFEDLNIPSQLIEWSETDSGLILLNGPTGSGKTTTLASVLQWVTSSRPVNIITLEKPIEYIIHPGAGTIVQRDVGNDTRDFSDGLTAAMRQDPDVIMVGEVRNRVEVDALIEATETGHLTFSTVHAGNCSIALHRLSSLYSKDEVSKILSALSVVSRGYVNQVLVLSPDGSQRHAVREILPFTEDIRRMVNNADIDGVYEWQFKNNMTMEQALLQACDNGLCTVDEAKKRAVKTDIFSFLLQERSKIL